MAVDRWFAAIILTPLAAVAAHSEPLQLKPLVPPPTPRESETRTLKLRLIEDPVFSPGPVHNSGMIAQTPVAKNATVGVGLLRVAPRRLGSGEYRPDAGAPSSRKAAVRFTLKF